MNKLILLLPFFLIANCSSETSSKETEETAKELPEPFPYEYTENIPVVDFAFPFDKSRVYHYVITSTYVDSSHKPSSFLPGKFCQVLLISDSSMNIAKDLKELDSIVSSKVDVEVDFLVQTKEGFGVVPTWSLGDYGFNGCFDFGVLKLFECLIDHNKGVLVNGEVELKLDDKQQIQNEYLKFINALSSITPVYTDNNIDSLLEYSKDQHEKYFIQKLDSLHTMYGDFRSLKEGVVRVHNIFAKWDPDTSMEEYLTICSYILEAEVARLNEQYGNESRELLRLISPPIWSYPPPPPPIATEVIPK